MDNELTLVVGTYTSGESNGIYTYRFNMENGKAEYLKETETNNPSYLTVSEDGKYIYAVSEEEGEKAVVNAFLFDNRTGALKLLNFQPTQGDNPCYVSTNGSYVVTANYSGGSISYFQLADDGTLNPAEVIPFTGAGTVEDRQDAPHLHCVYFTPDGAHLLATDLGTDHIYKFDINKNAGRTKDDQYLVSGTPQSFIVEPGSGPRHLTFSPDGKYAYVITELSGRVIVFQYEGGNLSEIQSIVADKLQAGGSGDIHITPDGKYLYASNRLEGDGLAIFEIQDDGMLVNVGYQLTGKHPRNFVITPNGKFLLLAARDSNVIEVYQIDDKTGLLTNTNQDIKLDKPVCLKFV